MSFAEDNHGERSTLECTEPKTECSTPVKPQGPRLAEPIVMRGVELPNRVVIAPMCTWLSDPGKFALNEKHFVHYGGLAMGGAGLIIFEATPVESRGCISPDDLGLWNDSQEAQFRKINDWIHTNSKSKTFLQVGHAGRKALMSSFTAMPPAVPLPSSHPMWVPKIAPSALAYNEAYGVPLEMTLEQIHDIKRKFLDTCVRAIRAGFDGIEIHNAHGYLLNQFTSPLSNKRSDDYGGSLEKRCKLSLEIAEELRKLLGPQIPIIYRISAIDWVPEGTSIEDSVWFTKELRKRGVDAIHVSSGGVTAQQQILMHSNYQTDLAAEIKKQLEAEPCAHHMQVIAVGCISEAESAEMLLQNGVCDMVAVARAALKDPYWPRHAIEACGGSAFVPQYQQMAYVSVRKLYAEMRSAREEYVMKEDGADSPLHIRKHDPASPSQMTTASIEPEKV